MNYPYLTSGLSFEEFIQAFKDQNPDISPEEIDNMFGEDQDGYRLYEEYLENCQEE